MGSRFEIARILVEVAHAVERKGFVAAYDGNISARIPNGNILITPSGKNKGKVAVEDLVEVQIDGKVVSKGRTPSSELPMHQKIYQVRPDVNAVVHCHPVHATAFASAGVSIPSSVFPEVILSVGEIPLARYATPSTQGVGDSLMPFLADHTAVLLEQHGAVTFGKDLWEAYYTMEKIEHTAHTIIAARSLGGERPLSSEQVAELKKVFHSKYL